MKHCFVVLLLVCALTRVVKCQNYDYYSYEDPDYGFGPVAPTTTTLRPRPRPTPRPSPISPPLKRPNTPTTSSPMATVTRKPAVDKNGQLIGCPCLSTQETNRVCGTDGLSYGNMGKLKCAQRCNHVVEVKHLGMCTKKPN